MELSVSILNSKDKVEMIKILNNTDISYIHLDVMDGIFVSQKVLSAKEIENLARKSIKKIDVHLMVQDPLSYIECIKNLKNIEYITIHLEIDRNIKEILAKIKAYGFKAGLSIKPNTDIDNLFPYIDDVDLILVMTVEPGLGGQPFILSSVDRIKEIKELVKDRNIKIEVDGGINNDTIREVSSVDIAVVGSYITKSDDPVSKINSLLV